MVNSRKTLLKPTILFCIALGVLLGGLWAYDSLFTVRWHGSSVSGGSERSANKNDWKTVEAEVNQPDFQVLLSKAAGISQWRMGRPNIRLNNGVNSWDVEEGLRKSVAEALSRYLSVRAQGHSAAYSQDVMRIGSKRNASTHTFLNDIPVDDEPVPESWISKVEKQYGKEGDLMVGLRVVDGELAWSHSIFYHSDGRFNTQWSECFDPVILSTAYREAIGAIEERIVQEMKAEGIEGLGSVHTYWSLKKKYLSEIGIDWKSPSVLNPSISYD